MQVICVTNGPDRATIESFLADIITTNYAQSFFGILHFKHKSAKINSKKIAQA